MQFSTVNDLALQRAAEAVVGPQATAAIMQLYKLIDQSMHDGYALGKVEATQGVEDAINAAFDNGWQLGAADATDGAQTDIEDAQNAGWDDGYLMGVSDARVRPSYADDMIIEILTDATAEAFNGEYVVEVEPELTALTYNPSNVSDSGDAQ